MRVVYLAISLFMSLGLSAQDQNTGEYIEFSEKKVGQAETFTSGGGSHGIYMGIYSKYGVIADDNALFLGGRIAYVADNKIEIGIGGMGFYSDHELSNLASDKILTGGYGGLHIEPILFGKQKIHLSIPILLGAGAIGLLDNDHLGPNDFPDEWDPYFIMEPGLNVVFKISNFIQLEAGVQYRFSNDVSLGNYQTIKDMNGFSAGVGIKMGVFNLGHKRMVQSEVRL